MSKVPKRTTIEFYLQHHKKWSYLSFPLLDESNQNLPSSVNYRVYLCLCLQIFIKSGIYVSHNVEVWRLFCATDKVRKNSIIQDSSEILNTPNSAHTVSLSLPKTGEPFNPFNNARSSFIHGAKTLTILPNHLMKDLYYKYHTYMLEMFRGSVIRIFAMLPQPPQNAHTHWQLLL